MSIYFFQHLLLALGAMWLWCIRRVPLSARAQLNLVYWVIALSLTVPFVVENLGHAQPFGPIVKFWPAEPNSDNFVEISMPIIKKTTSLPVEYSPPFDWTWMIWTFLLARLFFAGRAVAKGLRRVSNLSVRRRIGKVRVVDHGTSPFSLFVGSLIINLPKSLSKKQQRFALSHEIQHYRQGDTLLAYPLLVFQALFGFSPFTKSLIEQIHELQELTCDAALVGRRSFVARDYMRCLIDVAENQLDSKVAPTGAVGMAFRSDQLKRRLNTMLRPQNTSNLWGAAVITLITGALISSSAWALSGSISSSTLTLRQARYLAAKIDQDIPVVIDQRVLHWLNHALRSSGSRNGLKKALARMEQHRPMIERHLRQAGLPSELLAIPLIESSYKNQSFSSAGAAGIWQFMPQTARLCGLRVDEHVDERLQPELATEAAICYYEKIYAAFQDWHISVSAYNSGEHRMLKAITKAGHNDALKLGRDGFLPQETANYLPKALAAMIIIQNPDLLD